LPRENVKNLFKANSFHTRHEGFLKLTQVFQNEFL